MDVALAADRRCVAESLGDGLDRADDVALRLGLGIELFKRLQGPGGQDGGRPGPEVLRREVVFSDLPEIVVYIA